MDAAAPASDAQPAAGRLAEADPKINATPTNAQRPFSSISSSNITVSRNDFKSREDSAAPGPKLAEYVRPNPITQKITTEDFSLDDDDVDVQPTNSNPGKVRTPLDRSDSLILVPSTIHVTKRQPRASSLPTLRKGRKKARHDSLSSSSSGPAYSIDLREDQKPTHGFKRPRVGASGFEDDIINRRRAADRRFYDTDSDGDDSADLSDGSEAMLGVYQPQAPLLERAPTFFDKAIEGKNLKRIFKAGYNHPVPCARENFRRRATAKRKAGPRDASEEEKAPDEQEYVCAQVPKDLYLVIGTFQQTGQVEREICVQIDNRKRLFWTMWFTIIRLRGLRYVFSLKGVRRFRLYRCSVDEGTHLRVKLLQHNNRILHQLLLTYQKWHSSSTVNERWSLWVEKNLNHKSSNPLSEGRVLSVEVVLGWSPTRISVLVALPVLISLAIGLWYQWGQTHDATIVQTAWTIASYAVTTMALIAALIGFVSRDAN